MFKTLSVCAILLACVSAKYCEVTGDFYNVLLLDDEERVRDWGLEGSEERIRGSGSIGLGGIGFVIRVV